MRDARASASVPVTGRNGQHFLKLYLFCYPGKIESWQRVETTNGYIVCFTPESAEIDPVKPLFEKDFPFFADGANSILGLSQEDMDAIEHTAEALLGEMESENADNFETIQPSLKVLLIQVRRFHCRDKQAKTDFQLKQASPTYPVTFNDCINSSAIFIR